MNIKMNFRFTGIIFLSIVLITSCGESAENKAKREKEIADSIATVYKDKIIKDSIAVLKKENDSQYINFLTIGDSLFFEKEYVNAKTNYSQALKYTNDANNKKILNNKIVNCDTKIEYENSPITKVEKTLIGKHAFGVQFIWDGYGLATISKNEEILTIKGTQFSKDKSKYCKIKGNITIIDSSKFIFDGNIKIFTENDCGHINKTGKYTFIKKGKRKYWRLQEFKSLVRKCNNAYYLDIFE